MNQIYKQLLLAPVFMLVAVSSWAQATLSGKVIDTKGLPIKGASVSLDGTIDGSTTDSAGNFTFTTTETGAQTIVATEIAHMNAGKMLNITGNISGIQLQMKRNNTLGEVTITAGSFEASDKKTTLKPLDIVTTAGANADVVKAIETLPGVQQTGTESGLFVRGGDASEASILVDEMVVQNAFFSGAPGVATRSRFGAFQFQGVSFSSGGYSARYGQALSSVLELESTDLPEKSNVNLGINMAGVYASGTKLWKNSSLDIGGNYNNLTPFYGLATTNFKFYNMPVSSGGNIRYAWKPNKNGILKINANGSYTTSGVAIPNPYYGTTDTTSNKVYDAFSKEPDTVNYRTNDQYYFTNVSYKQLFKSKYSLYTAASYSLDKTNSFFGTVPIDEQDQRLQYRLEGKDFITSRLTLLVGGDLQHLNINKSYDIYQQTFTENLLAAYAEADWTPLSWFSVRPGVRYEHSELLSENTVAPRLAMGFRTGKYSQVSLAGGVFYQDPASEYLLAGYRPKEQQAIHYIANWEMDKNDRTLRIEGYYKNYEDLIRERYQSIFDPNTYRAVYPGEIVDNSGYGYAQGAELFWRDKKTFKNVDYWISYSYIDTKRLYNNYIEEATPTFISNHNLNLVAKYFVTKLNTNFSATYTYASGRPYYNPDPTVGFLSEKTPAFNNVALTVSYLHTFGKWFTVFYLSADNITNSHNIFGYRYQFATENGQYVVTGKSAVVPALYRSFIVGANFSLTQFKKDEL